MSSSTHPSVDIKFDFVPFNGTPGETYDKWERALLNAGARADDRGYSISDHLNGVDEGTAGNPHLSAAASSRPTREGNLEPCHGRPPGARTSMQDACTPTSMRARTTRRLQHDVTHTQTKQSNTHLRQDVLRHMRHGIAKSNSSGRAPALPVLENEHRERLHELQRRFGARTIDVDRQK